MRDIQADDTVRNSNSMCLYLSKPLIYTLTYATRLTMLNVKLKSIKYFDVFETIGEARPWSLPDNPYTSWLPWIFDPALAPWCWCGGGRLDHLLQEVHHTLLQLQTLDLEEVLLVQGLTDLPARLLYGPTRPLLLLQHSLHHPYFLSLYGEVLVGTSFPGWSRMRAGEQRMDLRADIALY